MSFVQQFNIFARPLTWLIKKWWVNARFLKRKEDLMHQNGQQSVDISRNRLYMSIEGSDQLGCKRLRGDEIKWFYNIFYCMPEFKGEDLGKLLGQSYDIQSSLKPFLKEVENSNIEWCFSIIDELVKHLGRNAEPIRKVNALAVACKLIEVANYPILLFSEIYLLPSITRAIEFAAHNKQFPQITTFFQREGYPTNYPHIQNLSYNFVSLACQLIQLAAHIKPFKIYQGRQYDDISLFKKEYDRLTEYGFNLNVLTTHYKKKDLQEGRENFLLSLARWVNYEQSIVFFFVQQLQAYLNNPESKIDYGLGFTDILKYGEVTVTSQIIARTVDIMTYNPSFRIRAKALELLDMFILWGDVEALLVVNFTEHVQTIVKTIWKVKGELTIDYGKNIYPDVEGQTQEKLNFYKLFLACLQRWAESYPNIQHFTLNSNSSDRSPVNKLYRLLKDKKGFIFPPNPNIVKYEQQSHKNLLQKSIRNLMILKEINNESAIEEISHMHGMSLKQVREIYQQNRQLLLQILNDEGGDLHQKMKKLAEYRQTFEELVENMDVGDEPSSEIDNLIENGMQLVDLIQSIHNPYMKYLHQEYSKSQFLDIITNMCIEYFTPSKNETDVKLFYSQKLFGKKQELKELMRCQKSNPLENQLNQITNNFNVQQYRSKYKHRIERLSNSHSSDQQSQNSMNLQIFTKNKFTRESREGMFKEMASSGSMKKEERKSLTNTAGEPFMLNTNSIIKTDEDKNKERQKSTIDTKQIPQNTKIQANSPSKQSFKKGRTENFLQVDEIETLQSRQHLPLQTRRVSNISNINAQKHHLVPMTENSHYFQYLAPQQFKFSYIYAHILIFNSPYLSIQRIIAQIIEEDTLKVRVQIILIPHQPLGKLTYTLLNQEYIALDDRTEELPSILQTNSRYLLTIVGDMRKIALKLPVICFYINDYHIFDYILPFTINFYLQIEPNQIETLKFYHQISNSTDVYFSTNKLYCSQVVFPQRQLHNLLVYFPNCLKLAKPVNGRDIYLWQVKYVVMRMLLIFQYSLEENILIIKICCTMNQHEDYRSFQRYILNYMAHLLAVRQVL